MKKGKFGLLLATVALIPLLSGCGKDKLLTCTSTEQDNTMKMDIVFNGNVVKEAKVNYVFDISAYNQEQKDVLKRYNLCDTLKSNTLFGSDAISNCNQTMNDNSINLDATFNVQKISTDTNGEKYTVESLKADLEKNGMTCNIK